MLRWARGAAGVTCTSAMPIDDERLVALLRPDARIRTVVTADVYGQGAADERSGAALAGLDRRRYRLVGHDRPRLLRRRARRARRAIPRFTDPALRGPDAYADYLRDGGRAQPRALRRRPLRRAAAAQPRPHRLLVARPSGTRMAALRDEGLTRRDRRRAGAGQRLHARRDRCLERFGDADRLGDADPEPVRAVARPAGAAGLRAHDVRCWRGSSTTAASSTTTCPTRTSSAPRDHRAFRPAGWVDAGARAARPDAADRRAPRPDPAAARLPVDAGAAGGRVRGADADPGAGRRRASRSRPSAPSWPASRRSCP